MITLEVTFSDSMKEKNERKKTMEKVSLVLTAYLPPSENNIEL